MERLKSRQREKKKPRQRKNQIWEDNSKGQRTVLSKQDQRQRDACNGDGQKGKNLRPAEDLKYGHVGT